ncbi:NADPH-dependent codeinone reductase-like protein [Melia azedarach]|uniref:NADPH-dependent codeinone reductase-like protein n=1 Tax=Melia azedarach TaxID=155640 RepID=A0ACC1Y1Q8_MELAZ|nr:NADPH-dependent codeinone reductase-like protein [Melia azedarach]
MASNTTKFSMFNIPEVKLNHSSGHRKMPVIGLGSAVPKLDEDAVKFAVLEAIKLGYRHFDTAPIYRTEKALGEAIAEALRLDLLSSRKELFITSKLWCNDAHPDLVVPTLKKSLRTLQLEYLDLYLIHWPISATPGDIVIPIPTENLLPMDYKGVWEAMEECQRLGLTKSIGVSNFSSKKIQTILSFATIPPSVNQVEMHPVWQQRKLREFCKARGIIVTAYSPLGAVGTIWGSDEVMENEVLKQIAKAHGKTVAQVSLRWIVEQGATVVVKSFNRERQKQNLGIFDWALTDDDYNKINQIHQHKVGPSYIFLSPHGPFKTLEELWDE